MEELSTKEVDLNHKLAEWAGFRYLPVVGYEGSVWVHPDWKYGNGKWDRELPDFTQFLDACFKWLVPKLDKLNITCGLIAYCDKDEEGKKPYYAWLLYPYHDLVAHAETPALALCRAIGKLIEVK